MGLLRKKLAGNVIVFLKDEFAKLCPNWESVDREHDLLVDKKGFDYIHNDTGPAMLTLTYRRPGKEDVAKTEEEIQQILTTPSMWPELLKFKEAEFALNGYVYTDLDEWKRDAHTETFNKDFFDRLSTDNET